MCINNFTTGALHTGTRILVCGFCGENHFHDKCSVVTELVERKRIVGGGGGGGYVIDAFLADIPQEIVKVEAVVSVAGLVITILQYVKRSTITKRNLKTLPITIKMKIRWQLLLIQRHPCCCKPLVL